MTKQAVVASATDLYETGVDSNHQTTTGSDSHWSLVNTNDTARTYPVAASISSVQTGWTTPSFSKWISVTSTGCNGGGCGSTNWYDYQTTFTLPSGVDTSTVSLLVLMTFDDDYEMFLNNQSILSQTAGSSQPWKYFQFFTYGPAQTAFQAGTNTLRIRITNSGAGVTGIAINRINVYYGSCSADSECGPERFCDTANSRCRPKLPAGDSIPTISGHTPTLSGTCSSASGAVPAAVCMSSLCSTSTNKCVSCALDNGATGSGVKCGSAQTKCFDYTSAARSQKVQSTCGCLVDSDCASGNWCNAGWCVSKLSNGTAMPKISGHSPTLNGDCATYNSTAAVAVCSSGVCDTTSDLCGIDLSHGTCSSSSQCNAGTCTSTKCCLATDATCNGIDDDCSGTNDEDYVTSTTSCGVGACARTGTLGCSSGATVDSCTPGAAGTEAPGNTVDEDCNGAILCYVDADNDGFRTSNGSTVVSADADCDDSGEATSSDPATDCDDTNSAIKPGVTELAGDEVDQNCDGAETCYVDADDDGYRVNTTSTVASADTDCIDAGEGTTSDGTGDCNDAVAAIRPGATETTGDSVDQNCDGAETCFVDADDDGYRVDTTSTVASADADCADPGEGTISDGTGDCNDTVAAIRPGVSEITGDSVDQNCDGAETCYVDVDDDGYRVDTTSTVASADTDCADTGEGTTAEGTGDCNDAVAAIRPGVSEITGDSVDQNCDGAETCFVDADDDGYRIDTTSTVASVDSDCSDAGEGTSADGTGDCNDVVAAIRPGTTEIEGDEVDQDCDGTELCFVDLDDDGYRRDMTKRCGSA